MWNARIDTWRLAGEMGRHRLAELRRRNQYRAEAMPHKAPPSGMNHDSRVSSRSLDEAFESRRLGRLLRRA